MNLKNFSLFIIIIVSFSSFAHNDNAYYHSAEDLPQNKSWMRYIDNKVRIRNISIPGTHGSAALYGGDIPRNQTLSITQQLNAGIRFLDIRLRHIDNVFALHHGVVYQKKMFGDILYEMRKFLESNPSEFIFVRVKEEHNPAGNTRDFEETFNAYVNDNSDIIWTPAYRTENPTLKEVRGKVVLLQNFAAKKYKWFGLDYHHSFNREDGHKLDTNWSLYSKWNKVKKHLNQANLNKESYINYLSGSTGSFPYFVASGHSSPGTSAPRLLTGLTNPGWKYTYPDFPRVGCFIGICSIAFEGTNTLTKNHILETKPEYVGIIASDFPGEGLIDAIINVNMEKLKIFEHGNFYGKSKVFNKSTPWVGNDFNDIISSMKIPRGFVFKAYEDANYKGRTVVFSGDVPWVGSNINDKISSFKLYKKGFKEITSNIELNNTSKGKAIGFNTLLKEYNALELVTRDGKWAPHFTLPSNADSGTKIKFKHFATWSSKVFYDNKYLTLKTGHEVSFIYNGSKWDYK